MSSLELARVDLFCSVARDGYRVGCAHCRLSLGLRCLEHLICLLPLAAFGIPGTVGFLELCSLALMTVLRLGLELLLLEVLDERRGRQTTVYFWRMHK